MGSCFHFLAIVNIAAVNIWVYKVSVQVCVFSFLECILSSVIAVLYANVMFNFWGTSIFSSIVVILFYILTWSLFSSLAWGVKQKFLMKYDIVFGSVAPIGGLLKQLLVSFQLPQISMAFILLNKGIEQHGLCIL